MIAKSPRLFLVLLWRHYVPRLSRGLLPLSMILMAVFTSCSALQPKGSVTTTATKNAIKLDITLPGSAQAGHAVDVVVRLTNTGPVTVFFPEIDGVRELGIRVLDSNSATPELTDLGKARLGTGSSQEGYEKYVIKALASGQYHEWRIDLNALYKLAPGKYHLSLSIELNLHLTPFVISEDPVEFNLQ